MYKRQRRRRPSWRRSRSRLSLIHILVLIFGEVSPKSIAKESPERFAMFSAPLLRGFIFCLTPVNFLFRQWKKLLSLVFKPAGNGAITEEELLTFVEEVQQGGGIDEQEGALCLLYTSRCV